MATAETTAGPFATSAFRIAATAVAILLFAALALALLLMRDADDAVSADVTATITAEADRLAAVYRSGGREQLIGAVGLMALAPGRGLYAVLDRSGRLLAGNLQDPPRGLRTQTASAAAVFTYRSRGENNSATSRRAAGVTLAFDDGSRVIVARDVEDQSARLQRMRLVLALSFGAMVVAGLAGGYAVSRHLLRRVQAVDETARSIMAGDLARRIPLAGADDEITRLGASLNAMLDRIELLVQGMREVSDNIAHDLKTPLNRLRNRAEAALRERSGEDGYRQGLEQVIEEADELIKTFNALLLIARLEAGALDEAKQRVDVAQLVRDVAELYQPVAEEQGLAIAFSAEHCVELAVNRHLVGQAVANLVDNAIKYAGVRPGAAEAETTARPALIEIRVGQQRGGAEISVVDRGPGIAPADRERVLKRFVRLERSRSRPGTGLGLSLVAAVARLHGGDLRLEDAGPGLRAVLTLPGQAAIAAT